MEFLRPWRSWPLPFRNWFPIKILSCVSLKKSRETKGIGDHSLFYTSRHMLDSRWNGQQEIFSGALQDDAVSYMKFIHLRTVHHHLIHPRHCYHGNR